MSKAQMPALYGAFKSYVRFLTEKVYYKKVYYLNIDNVPQDGTSLLVVSDHQNSMNDALGILMSINDRIVHFIVRADVFALSPVADKFLRSIGLLPAFRMKYEGEEALGSNGATFRDSEKALLDGSTVVIYPEAGHQDRHWLGTFSYGYTRMAFEAAEMGGFGKEIFILPSCNHYSHYKGLRTEMLVKFGTPISLKPFYELYKTKPRTAQREVNALVREQIKGLMLNIEDLENYDAIDSIRQGSYGAAYALCNSLDPFQLPQKLESDKKLVAALAEAKAADQSAVQSVYDGVTAFYKDLKNAGLDEAALDRPAGAGSLVMQAAVLAVLFPLAVFSLWPSVPAWLIPKYFADKAEDDMFSGTFLIALNALFIFPVLGILTFIVTWVKTSLLAALIYVAAFPLLCLFEWSYVKWFKELLAGCRAMAAGKSGLLGDMKERRNRIFSEIDKILKK